MRDCLSVRSIGNVIGGRIGRDLFPKVFCSPRSDQSMRWWSEGERGSCQPCTMCQARIAERYFHTVVTDTGSNGMVGTAAVDSDSGSVATHNAKEWISWNDAGRRALSGMKIYHRKYEICAAQRHSL